MRTDLAAIVLTAVLLHLSPSNAATRCEQSASRTVAFTSPAARDVLEIGASGSVCEKAVVTVSIRDPDGVAVAAFAMPLHWLDGGLDTARSLTGAALSGYLQTYVSDAQLDLGASTLPVWTKRSPTPGFEQGMELTSPLPRKEYEALRKAKPNMLCLREAFETFACYVWNSASKRAEVIVRH